MSKLLVTAGWDDVPHLDKATKERLLSAYPEHERAARTRGEPLLGSGKVFPVDEALIKWTPTPLVATWARIVGLDFGWDHPTAAAWLAWDRDTDTVYVYDAYRAREQTPVFHAATIKAKGKTIPVAWPHDGLQHDKGSGEQLANIYRSHDVAMLKDKATFPDGSNGLEAGITMMLERMQTGRLKVAEHLTEWWDEFRMYHRKDGLIVKERDDLLSATRYGLMMLRKAEVIDRPRKATTKGYTPAVQGVM